MTVQDTGTYEVLTRRLRAAGEHLAAKATRLNTRRSAAFGARAIEAVAAERVRTEHDSLPRDLAAVKDMLLFGFNTSVALGRAPRVDDVLALYQVQIDSRDGARTVSFRTAASDMLRQDGFARDFDELYRYYKDARLVDLKVQGNLLLAVFQTGVRISDVRVMRWRVADDITYVDMLGEGDYVRPDRFDFAWHVAGRDDYRQGRHPVISIQDEVFVDPRRGTLDLRVEDGSPRGKVIFSEKVDQLEQDLVDCHVEWARLGSLIALKVKPYLEDRERYIVYSVRSRHAVRVDSVGESCLELPDGQGLISPGGLVLQDGTVTTFEHDHEGMRFEARRASPNGEDVLYVFREEVSGMYVLVSYNVIRKAAATPILCHGYSILENGDLVIFREDANGPGRLHMLQLWQSPYYGEAAVEVAGTDPLTPIGNADLVRGISDAYELSNLAARAADETDFAEIVRVAQKMVNAYFWLADDVTENFATSVDDIKQATHLLIGEHHKVQQARQDALDRLADLTSAVADARLQPEPDSGGGQIAALGALQELRGRAMSLRELRHVDAEALDGAVDDLDDLIADRARRTVEVLSRPGAFDDVLLEIASVQRRADAADKAVDLRPLIDVLDERAGHMSTLSETVAGLEFSDATRRSGLMREIGRTIGEINTQRALVANRIQDLSRRELADGFEAETLLVAQTVSAGLAGATSPQALDEALGRVMLSFDKLEAVYGEIDDYVPVIAAKRQEAYDAFTSAKQGLLDDRARRAERMFTAATVSLSAIARRLATFDTFEQVNTFVGSDLLMRRVADVADQLTGLDPVKADELLGLRRKTIDDATRDLRDRRDLGDGASIRLGAHRFTVVSGGVELSARVGDTFELLIDNTDYREQVHDTEFLELRDVWNQPLVSENDEVYRGEYLASRGLARKSEAPGEDLAELIDRCMRESPDEGYERGVHDIDAIRIAEALWEMRDIGVLRFPAAVRAAALHKWFALDDATRAAMRQLASSLRAAGESDPELFARALGDRAAATDAFSGPEAAYLYDEQDVPQVSVAARDLQRQVDAHLVARGLVADYRRTLDSLPPGHAMDLARTWVDRVVPGARDGYVIEAAMLDVHHRHAFAAVDATAERTVRGLVGRHPRIENATMVLDIAEFTARLDRFRVYQERRRRFGRLRRELVAARRQDMRLDDLKPSVMASFVRNRLIDRVYLPLIGDNFAKQVGALDQGRADRSGLLLLISPPGYGKTTLMEYVAARLGLFLVKINGPALGTAVTSLDPAEAPTAPARREIERLNFALEMGNNVMLYLDDIQHTSAEFLQKFIPLADSTRRIEGVWRQPKSFDLRGKRFALVMAGNPYTQAGQRFVLPDMLANRADVYNLGDSVSEHEQLFIDSYVENALSANTTLSRLVGGDPADVHLLMRAARGEQAAVEDLSAPYSAGEIDEMVRVLAKLQRVADLLFRVNALYVASAAQREEDREEPAFKLQGSYRNMARIAQRVVPVLSDEELEAVIDDHYRFEAQTLSRDAESNMLKLAIVRGRADDSRIARYQDMVENFRRQREIGDEDDPRMKIVASISHLGSILDRANRTTDDDGTAAALTRHLVTMERLVAHLAGPGGDSDR